MPPRFLPTARVHPAVLSRNNPLGAGGDPSREQGYPTAVWCWVPQYKKDIKLSECPKETTKMANGVKEKPYKEQLRTLALLSLEKRRLRAELITGISFLSRGSICSL